jgi:DsbC/DsbD-like thiol-disulfide interchange protein
MLHPHWVLNLPQVLVLVAACMGTTPLGAQTTPKMPASASTEVEAAHVQFSVMVSPPVAKPGDTITLRLRYVIDPEWHIYWPGINDTGRPPTWKISLPEGWPESGPESGQQHEAQWPAPKRHESPGDILDHIYENAATISVPMHIPATAAARVHTFTIASDWLVCKEACIFEHGEAKVSVTVDPQATEPAPAPMPSGDRSLESPVVPLTEDARVHATVNCAQEAGQCTLSISAPQATRVEFYPKQSSLAFQDLLSGGSRAGSSLSLTFESKSETHLEGIIAVTRPLSAQANNEDVKTREGSKSHDRGAEGTIYYQLRLALPASTGIKPPHSP